VESISKSLAYWSIGNGDDTMVTLWNPADEAQDLVLRLFFSGGHYLHPIHLGPRASYTFNISEIVHNQIPDSEGNIIPADVYEGSAKISGSQAENQHILVAIDAGNYNVRKATCGYVCFSCDGYTSYGISPSSFTVPVGGTQAMQFLVNYDSGFQFNDTLYTDWTSTNSSVVSVGVPNTNYDIATGVAAGSATITADDTYYNPPYVPYQCFPAGMNCPITENQLGGEASASVVSASITLHSSTSQSVSGSDSASGEYESITGTSGLGVRTATQSLFKACFAGLEFAGAVSPSGYSGTLHLHRTLLSCGTYDQSNTSVGCGTTPRDDSSGSSLVDDDPGTSGGNIYDLDTPGVQNGNSSNSVYRFRANFSEYATLDDGVTVVSTSPVNYYVRVSCQFDGSGNPSLNTAVSGDNQVGSGTTNTSWNLQ